MAVEIERKAAQSKGLARAGRGSVYVVLFALAAVTLTPLVWLIAATVKGPDDLFHYTFFAPRVTAANFQDLFRTVPFLRYMMNSFFIAGCVVTVQLFFSSLAGFALAKYEFRGKKAIMVLMLATMMIPGQVVMAPLYELIYRMGLVDTYAGLVVPGAVSVFGIFLFRQASLGSVPVQLLEAARIDGANGFQIFRDITWPSIAPVAATIVLIRLIEAFKIIDLPNVLTGGGPGLATESMTLHSFIAWRTQDLGGSAAVGYLLLFVSTIVCVSFFNFVVRPARRFEA